MTGPRGPESLTTTLQRLQCTGCTPSLVWVAAFPEDCQVKPLSLPIGQVWIITHRFLTRNCLFYVS